MPAVARKGFICFRSFTQCTFGQEAFTRVLLGVIDVETAIFPSSLDGNDIGVLARLPLYEVGLNYRHGTGHGVGQYLTIHECNVYIHNAVWFSY